MSYTELSFLVGTQTNYVKNTSTNNINTSETHDYPHVTVDVNDEDYMKFNIFGTKNISTNDKPNYVTDINSINNDYNDPKYLNVLDMEEPLTGKDPSVKNSDFTETRYVYSLNSNDSHNYIKGTINSIYNSNLNPYSKLVEDFNGKDNQSKRLQYSDFVYLRDIGVYPINRLMILRRFNGSPDYDLTSHKKKILGQPISTVVGWVKNDEDMFNMSFNEVWKNQSKWLHELVQEIIQTQFGIDVSNIFPIPGWGQGFIFNFLNNLGITNYGGKNLPIGDANLLRDAITRETTTTGLATNISLKLETCYEIKYINGIDPTIAFHNIINNLLRMGTSNMNFLFKPGGTIGLLGEFMDNPNTVNLMKLMDDMIGKVIQVLKREINNLKTRVQKKVSGITETKNESVDKQLASNNEKAKEKALLDFTRDSNYKSKYDDLKGKPYITSDSNKQEIIIANEDLKKDSKAYKKALKNEQEENNNKARNEAGAQVQLSQSAQDTINSYKKLSFAEETINFITGLLDTVLSATMARYKWPIRGAIAQATGLNITPWHLTIGNPAAPIISMNQIKVDNVDVRLGSEMLFNDLPKYIYATISISNARPLGKQEIMRFFGVNFKRNYTKPLPATLPSAYTEENLDKDKQAKDAVSRANEAKTIKINRKNNI